jgi:hypothetical protein
VQLAGQAAKVPFVVGGVAAGFAVITASNVPFTWVAGSTVVSEYPGWQVTHCTPCPPGG